MSNITADLNTVEALIAENYGNTAVINAALRLQLALLALGVKRVRDLLPKRVRVRIIDGLTEAEAAKAREPAGKIPAIKLVRERFIKYGKSIGLKEAKDIVEAWMQKHLGFMYWPQSAPVPTPSSYDENGWK